MKIFSNLVDLHRREIYPAEVCIAGEKIEGIRRIDGSFKTWIMPGFIDAHVHIESSMLTPSAFSAAAVTHGTIGTVSDPHEIANVLGVEGVEYMIEDGEKSPFYFWFGAPSCVPATPMESSGAKLDSEAVELLLGRKEIKYLSEMMNFPGVINGDKDVLRKIEISKKLNKPVDGHAPGLKGEGLVRYVNAGISTDHECSSYEEAVEKVNLGMKILIREGSAARNLESLKNLLKDYPDKIMICSDDLHPETLLSRHIEKIAASLIREGFDIFDVLRACSLNAVEHYDLEAGMLKEGDSADFIVIDNLDELHISETWIKGQKVYSEGKVLFSISKGSHINKFNCKAISPADLRIENKNMEYRLIVAYDGELLTGQEYVQPGPGKFLEPEVNSDILKIVVKDRYNDAPPAIGFIRGFGLKKGAFASSVAHDSHNIICVGTNDYDIARCVNSVVGMKGGLAVWNGTDESVLRLPIAGLMTDRSISEVASVYENLDKQVKAMGCGLKSPFMTLSFMALLVIPSLKIGDRGLFDVSQFKNVPLYI